MLKWFTKSGWTTELLVGFNKKKNPNNLSGGVNVYLLLHLYQQHLKNKSQWIVSFKGPIYLNKSYTQRYLKMKM